MGYEYRFVEPERADMHSLQALIDSNEEYYNLITGYPPGLAESQTLFSSVPDGVSYEDKFVFVISEQSKFLACADVLRNYPQPGTAEIGIFLVNAKLRRQKLGRRLIESIETTSRKWSGIKKLRCEIPDVLPHAPAFLRAVGFHATGLIRPYRYSNVRCTQEILEKEL